MSLRIGYFVNQYPKVSHSFIRREILALERKGVAVERIALRGWDAEVVDPEDREEQARTRYVLRDGLPGLVPDLLRTLAIHPTRFFRALQVAVRMGRHADRPLALHLMYLIEACRVARWLTQSGARHTHAHFGTNPAEIVMLARELGGPSYSFTVHGPEEFDKPLFLGLPEKIARSQFVVGISSYGRSQMYRWLPYEQWQKVQEIHCGLEPGFHSIDVPPPPAAPRMVCVGRLCEQKGQMLLVEAAGRLKADGLDFELVLAGDGEMRPEVEALIDRLGLRDQIRITGWISSDQVRDELLAARALVLPSFAEGLPVVIMEAMALKRPVVTTYVAGIPELVRDGDNGWLIPAGSVTALAEATRALLTVDPERLQEMGEKSYARVLARHDIDIEAAKLKALFEDMA